MISFRKGFILTVSSCSSTSFSIDDISLVLPPFSFKVAGVSSSTESGPSYSLLSSSSSLSCFLDLWECDDFSAKLTFLATSIF